MLTKFKIFVFFSYVFRLCHLQILIAKNLVQGYRRNTLNDIRHIMTEPRAHRLVKY